jgi:ATP-dependent Clp protease ATP-binding subunit ClpA
LLACQRAKSRPAGELGFQFLDGPDTPKPEKLPVARLKAKRRASPRPKGDGMRGSVPKVPLIKA